jgi:hypothetical protein
MGPDPEAWEFVWVGTANIQCVGFQPADGFCDVPGSAAEDEIEWLGREGATVGCRPNRYCVDSPATRGEVASMAWRLMGAPAPVQFAPFVDVYRSDHFAPAVDWLWSEGLTTGTSATTFSPDRPLTGTELLALLIRLEAHPDVGARSRPPGVDAPTTSSIVTRAELASVLRWWVG